MLAQLGFQALEIKRLSTDELFVRMFRFDMHFEDGGTFEDRQFGRHSSFSIFLKVEGTNDVTQRRSFMLRLLFSCSLKIRWATALVIKQSRHA